MAEAGAPAPAGKGRLLEVVFNLPVAKSFLYAGPPEVQVGRRVMAPFGRRRLPGFVIGEAAEAPEGLSEIRSVERLIDAQPLFDESLLELARWLSQMYLCSLGEALAAMIPGGRRETEPEQLGEEAPLRTDVVLSPAQTAAVREASQAREGSFYVHGVTGSGKTEVFLRVAEAKLRAGRGVIYLVPEISLTHQVVEIFSATFGREVAVLHSGLTPSQRLKEWLQVFSGQKRLVIGARSAVFAPVRRLGLVIIDEEHEGTYKSGTTPRYHARQVAMHRCRQEGAVLLMGSATPSVEAFHHMHSGTLRNFTLAERLSGGSLPQVRIQDLRGEPGPLSRTLIAELRSTHGEGRQSILFLNRRGFAHFFHCRSCGYEMKCRHCSVSLTFHKARNTMVCHYCGYRAAPVQVCPDCGSLDVGYSGFGTERVEEELRRLLPELRIERVDTDAVQRRGVLRRRLADFRAGRIDVLLGTQMVAKGLNFPGVKLVGIVSADTGLQLPDFRAAERTFNLIVQVSGRAGRFHPDGKVLVQTFMPDNEIIRLAAAGREEEFYLRELQVRRQLGFPPYSRLVRLVFRASSAARASEAARLFAGSLPDAALVAAEAELLGPAECPLAVIAGRHRMQVILRGRRFRELHRLAALALEGFKGGAGVKVEVDVDPVSLL